MRKIEPLLVVVDSNTLCPSNKAHLVSRVFTEKWNECLKVSELTLVVPEVVKGARIYQMLVSLGADLASARSALRTTEQLSGDSIPLPDGEALKEIAERKFNDWVHSVKGEMASVPVTTIDWHCVVNDSIWRNPPFLPSTKDESIEKGFRDCLVLNTLKAVAQERANNHIAFVCNDGLLRSAVIGSVGSPEWFSIHENLDDLRSFLQVRKEKHSDELAKAILIKATETFHKPADSTSIYCRFNIADHITRDFQSELSAIPAVPIANSLHVFYEGASFPEFQISSTHFDERTDTDAYCWISTVRVARHFRLKPEGVLNSPIQDAVLLNEFSVKWTSKVDIELRFTDVSIVSIAHTSVQTVFGEANVIKYGVGRTSLVFGMNSGH
jgi:hypothetical protein